MSLTSRPATSLTLFLAGDVMLGRGIDQIQRHRSAPLLHEPYVRDAREYVRLAEAASGAIPHGVAPSYVWGAAIDELARRTPAARVINLETSLTRCDTYDRQKAIHYRMHPANVDCLLAAQPDVCVLANNHVLDYGREGLVETLETLEAAGIATVGAGRDGRAATASVAHRLPGGGRLVISASGAASSGIAGYWSAGADRPGVDVLPDLRPGTARRLADRVVGGRGTDDIAMVSLHWGDNWGYEVEPSHVAFAHALVDGGVDLVFGHSSHHPRPFEVYRDRLILYGAGDFLNDYEGIEGFEAFRGDLVLMYFPALAAATGQLLALDLVPLRIRSMRLEKPTDADAQWMVDTLNRVGDRFGCRVSRQPDHGISLVSA